MGFAFPFCGVVMPMLLMLSPLALAVARNCADTQLAAKATASDADRPCRRPRLVLM